MSIAVTFSIPDYWIGFIVGSIVTFFVLFAIAMLTARDKDV